MVGRPPARFIEPVMFLAVNDLPAGPELEYEVKFESYRANRGARLPHRRSKALAGQMSAIA
jgi:hypothetical protein